MYKDKKPVISKRSYPSLLAPDEVKNTEAYGLSMAKAIESEWWLRDSNSSGSEASEFYNKRSKFHKLRLYSRGEQDTSIYKNLVLGGSEDSYSNFDWRPLQTVPKFVNLIVNQMGERLFQVKADAVDSFSTDLKNKKREELESNIRTKPVQEAALEKMGVDIRPMGHEDLPENREEVDLYMDLEYKTGIEIGAEEAIKYTLSINDYEETQTRVIKDLVDVGIGVTKTITDKTKGILVKYVDPASFIHSYAGSTRNFKDVHYFGEVERITINELQRLMGKKFNDEELKSIAESSVEWSKYHQESEGTTLRSGDLQGMMVSVLNFNFKSTNTLKFKKKHLKNKGFKMSKKESTFKKKDSNYKGYDVVSKVIDVWYRGSLVLGTEIIFNYGLTENMPRDKKSINKTLPEYSVFSPEIYQNKPKGLVERLVPYIDQMQLTHIKIQQLIAKAKPNGIFIDINGLDEVDLGGGNTVTPLEIIKIYNETGNLIGSTVTEEGGYNNGRVPVTELSNGVVQGVDRLVNTYNHYLNLVRDAIGIPQGADASTPHHDMAVGIQQQLALNSNTATRHILTGALNISKEVGLSISLRLKDIFKFSDIKESYIRAIGAYNVKALKALEKYHLHDIGITISLKPDAEEKTYLENNIQVALSKDAITLDDAQEVRAIDNIKLANSLLKVKRVRREKSKREHELQLSKNQSEGQAQAQQIAAQSKQQEIQAKTQADISIVMAKAEAEMKKLELEARLKEVLMEKEFNFNLQLRGAEVDVKNQENKYKEDRKDSRQDRNNTQQSQLIEQRQYNTPSKDFESSGFDNVGNGMGIGNMGPS